MFNVVIADSYDLVSSEAFKVVHGVMAKENPVLGLATGSSPVGLYKKMIADHNSNGTSYKKTLTFNLDEYIGIPRYHEQSYYTFMHENLFDGLHIPEINVRIPRGDAEDIEAECARYEEELAKHPIDIQVLGIGSDGHIAFNEPGTSLSSRTSVVYLTPSTIKDNARLFFKGKENEVPTRALSMGVGTICEAKKIVLLAFGEGKQNAIKGCVEGPMTQFCTASALQAHNDCWIFCDEAAAKKLTLKKYYAWRSATKLGL